MKSIKLLNTEPKRLDVALAEALTISRSKAQAMIAGHRVSVDGKEANAHLLVSETSNVELADAPIDVETITLSSLPPLVILYEDADAIVINKPAGLLVHPTATSTEPTLLDLLRVRILNLDTIGDDKTRSGIVHRLDKAASGVLIVAKTNPAFIHLKQQFAERLTEKHYTTLVMGLVTLDEGTINFPIARSKTNARMAARPNSQEGKEAITHYDVIQRYANATLLDVRIETGRTHQIRAHFFALGHPVAGDALYLQRGVKQLKMNRLFLHARSLTITLPNGEKQTFTAPLPPELETVLKSLTIPKPQTLPRSERPVQTIAQLTQ